MLERTAEDDLFPAAMVVQHEEQHDETMFATLQLRQGPPVLLERRSLPPGRPLAGERVLVAGGPFVLGVDASEEPFSLDNERPAHTVDVAPFWIGRVPVTNAQWREFIADGGYARPELWSDRGWAHRVQAGLERPQFWTAHGTRRRFGLEEDVPPGEPVQHVCYFEAEAFATWSRRAAADRDRVGEGVRLGSGRPGPGGPGRGARPRPAPRWPTWAGWACGPPRPGPTRRGASAYGAEQLIGDVWEWTSSDFTPWPGFVPMIYRAYSEPFFGGDYKVLRGGSWATATAAIRPSFRNWDHPIRRQIFTGVRLAWDV